MAKKNLLFSFNKNGWNERQTQTKKKKTDWSADKHVNRQTATSFSEAAAA